MEVEFNDDEYDRLETDAKYAAGFSQAIVSAYRKRMQQIRSALDERDLLAIRSLKFEKLKGDRKHQHSIRLNDQWRLILELRTKNGGKTVHIIKIEDYH